MEFIGAGVPYVAGFPLMPMNWPDHQWKEWTAVSLFICWVWFICLGLLGAKVEKGTIVFVWISSPSHHKGHEHNIMKAFYQSIISLVCITVAISFHQRILIRIASICENLELFFEPQNDIALINNCCKLFYFTLILFSIVFDCYFA